MLFIIHECSSPCSQNPAIYTWTSFIQTVFPQDYILKLSCHLLVAVVSAAIWLVLQCQNIETGVITYILTYLPTPCSGVLLEKLTSFQLVKKFLAFYGTQRFITTFTSARHLSLSWTRSIQSMPPPTSWRPVLILSSHLCPGLPSGLFPSGFPTKPCVHI